MLPSTVLDQVNKIFFRFLWKRRYNNKKAFEKIKRKVLYNDLSEGGLRMVDVVRFQDSVLLNWAEKLIAGEHLPWTPIVKELFKDVGGINVFKSRISPEKIKGLHLVLSDFWSTVLKTWLKYSHNCKTNVLTLGDPIFNNDLITFKHETLFLSTCISKGIIALKDVMVDGILLSQQEFADKTGMYSRSVLDYNIISNAMKNKVFDLSQHGSEDFQFQGNKVGNLGRKFFYSAIVSVATPLCVSLWERKYGIIIDNSYWKIVCELDESRLKALSWKIIHNIYPTNILLYKMKISQSQNCKYCNVVDYVEHFFFHCAKVRPLWNEIQKDIKTHLGVTIKITEQLVLLGAPSLMGMNTICLKTVNHIIAIGKLAISKFKYGKQRNIIEIYETDCKIRKVWK